MNLTEHALRQLHDLLTRQEITVFLGPDLPEQLTGIPGWPELAKRLEERGSFPVMGNWPTAAARYEQAVGRRDLIDWLNEQLSNKTVGPIYPLLSALPVSKYIASTYDELLQRSLISSGRHPNIIIESDDLNFIKSDRPSVIKLLGEVSPGRLNSLLLTATDLQRTLHHRADILKQEVYPAMIGQTLLILGQDVNSELFRTLYYKGQDNVLKRQSYAVWSNLEEWEKKTWKEAGLTIIDADPLEVIKALMNNSSVPNSNSSCDHIPFPKKQNTQRGIPHDFPQPAKNEQNRKLPPMNVFKITIRHRQENGWPVTAEYSRPGELSRRAEGRLLLPEDYAVGLRMLQLDAHGYGTLLGKALFQGTVLLKFMKARAQAEDSEGPLHVLLAVEAPDLGILRWERLCAPDSSDVWDFLALDQNNPLSLHLTSPTDRRFPTIGRSDLSALVLLADPPPDNPYGLAAFDAEATAASVGRVLGDIPFDLLGPVKGAVGPADKDTLYRRITERKYTLLHLTAHGMCRNDGETILYLLDAGHRVAPLSASDLIRDLKRLRGARGLPHLAFFCACESAKPEAEAGLGGLAQRLVRDLGLPAVVAMTDPVSIATAEELAASFYRRLRVHGQPDQALTEACAGMQNRPDILVPALYSRLGGGPLFGDKQDGNSSNNAESTRESDLRRRYLDSSSFLSKASLLNFGFVMLAFFLASGIIYLSFSGPDPPDPPVIDPITGMQFVHVTGGCFQMGSPDNEPGRSDYEVPRHEVCVDDFRLGKYEVTQGQWVKVMGGMEKYQCEYRNGDEYPMEKVSWNDIQEFITELNKQSGRAYRLPTEAEWEYAARAGTTTSRWWGDDISCNQAMYGNGKDNGNDRCMKHIREKEALTPYSTAPVGSYPKNQFGLYDMLGNVSEFCSNRLGLYPSERLHNPQGPSVGDLRVFRGGSLSSGDSWIRSAARYGLKPDERDGGIGFRLVLPVQESFPQRNSSQKSLSGSDENMPEPVTGMEFVSLPGGCFQMGSPETERDRKEDEGPVHEVCLDGFQIGKFEVTQGQWKEIMENNPAHFKDETNCEGNNCDRYPVESIDWNQVQDFIAALNEKTGKQFRLPSEAEWEYACRANSQKKYCGGNDPASVAWYSVNQPRKVGTKHPNEFGLYDMSGNVREWCSDWYQRDYYASSRKKNR